MESLFRSFFSLSTPILKSIRTNICRNERPITENRVSYLAPNIYHKRIDSLYVKYITLWSSVQVLSKIVSNFLYLVLPEESEKFQMCHICHASGYFGEDIECKL